MIIPPDRGDDLRDARKYYRRNLAETLLSSLIQLVRDCIIKFLCGQSRRLWKSAEVHPVFSDAVDTIGEPHATSSASTAGSSAQPVISILLARLAATRASQVRPLDSR